MILVDTSVWIDHLRVGEAKLVALLGDETVLTHPLVIGELACGSIRNRAEVLDLIGRLPKPPIASDVEALELIDRHKLTSKGIGYIDVHLLASTLLMPGARLWTKDNRLASIASELKIEFVV
ncbi:MAG TPA: type II toxin-antitoxin system VapC family toxin [Gemmatimonadaceae bacterium]|nr:type II toxin-antitoxin system VapC family toxin [Gemmatimonadaceae bacterium]